MFTHLQKIRFLELINKPDRRTEPGKNVNLGNLNGGQGTPLHFRKLVVNLWTLFTCVCVCVCVCVCACARACAHKCASIHAHMHFSTNTDFRCRFVRNMVPHHWTIGGRSSEKAWGDGLSTALSQTIRH